MATKDLQPGDVLRRFSDQGDPRGGTIAIDIVGLVVLCVWKIVFVFGFFLRAFLCSLVHVCVCVIFFPRIPHSILTS